MAWLPDKYQSLRETMRRGDVSPDVQEELEHHLAMRIEQNLAAGMSREAAERDARRRFGSLERYQEETRKVEQGSVIASRRQERFTVARQEARRAWRALLRARTFSVAAIATLSIGIGATAAIFAILDAVVLRPLRYPDADRLVRIYHPVPKIGPGDRWNISQAEFFHFGKQAHRIEAIGLFAQDRFVVMADGQSLPVNASVVTASTLAMLGAVPRLGRLLTEGDNDRRAPRVVVLSENFWRSRFGASPNAIGVKVRIEGGDATVVGVLAAGLDLPDWRADIWIPTELEIGGEARNNHVFKAIARLRAGQTLGAAETELKDMLSSYPDRFPTAYHKEFFARTGFTTSLVRWKDDIVGDSKQVLWVLFGAVTVVLLIAGFNVGNLFVVRSQLTRREVALRTALGADRRHLAWHHLAESGLVCFGAAVIGIAIAQGGLTALVHALGRGPGLSQSGGPAVPRLAEIGLGFRGVGFALGLGLLATFGFGLAPLLAPPPSDRILRQSGRGLTASRRESVLRGGLVVAQITFAVVLLAAAGLMLRTFRNLRSVEPGFEPRGVAVLDVALPYMRYQDYPETVRFYRGLVDGVRAIPVVQNASVGSDIPIDAGDGCSVLEYPERTPDVDVSCIQYAMVGPGYFTTLGIRLEGRDLQWSDVDGKTGAVLVSDVLAKRLWRGGPAIDKGLNGPNDRAAPPYRVVGISRSLRWRGLDRPPLELAFFPIEPLPKTYLWSPMARGVLIVKTDGVDGAAIVPRIREIARQIDPEVGISNYREMEQVVAHSLLRVRVMMTLLVLASVAAVFLSVVGLYGVIAYLVNRRTQEIGIRIALGASTRSVRGRVVGQSLQLAVLGVGLGVLGGLALTRSLAALLFGVSPRDPLTLTVAGLTLLVVALGASLIPAHRATRIDPIEALRSD